MGNTKKEVNRLLAQKYGKALDGRANYRVVFANEEFENREGHFNDFHSDIFIRTVKEKRRVPKYVGPDFKDFWILEKLVPIPDGQIRDELCGLKEDYFPCWVLRTNSGKRLPLSWKAINNFIWMGLYGHKMTVSEMQDKENQRAVKDQMRFVEMMNDENPWEHMQAAHGERIYLNDATQQPKEAEK